MHTIRHKWLTTALLIIAIVLPATATAQSGLYIPSAKPVKNMQKALQNPEVFCLLIKYDGASADYDTAALDLLDSAYRIAFDLKNPMYYTMDIEGYGDADERLSSHRVEAVYQYFARRCHSQVPIRRAMNKIHCSCQGDTVETLLFEVPVNKATYDCAQLPEARRMLNKTIDLRGSVLVTLRHNPDECVGAARGCQIPAADSVVRGYYASLFIARGAIRSVDNTKDNCPSNIEIKIDDHLDYRSVVEQYNMVPHRKQLIVQAGYVVLDYSGVMPADSCTEPLKDSIFIRIPVTKEQMEAKLKFYAKVKTARGVEYKAMPTRKMPGKAELGLQAPINLGQFDTIYIGKRIQDDELGKYFYKVDGPTEAAAFEVNGTYYVAYHTGKRGAYELKKPLAALFRIIPEQEEEIPSKKDKKNNPEENID